MQAIDETLAGVHTHTHTHTSNLINKNKKINITKNIAIKPINI